VLTIERDLLEKGLDIIEDSFEEVLGDESFLEAHGLVETRK
jgi:hypothetical protein